MRLIWNGSLSTFQKRTPNSMSSFEQFNLDPRILSAIERIGYKEPTPIQFEAIPVVMKGETSWARRKLARVKRRVLVCR